MSTEIPEQHRTDRLAGSWPIVLVMCLVVAWALIDLARSYPDTFYPRVWDEAVYVMDVSAPGALLSEHRLTLHYAPAKLGYGLPLAAAFGLFGDSGAMYLSTLLWFFAIVLISVAVYRRFGVLAGAFAAAFLSYSPFFGKSVAEASPTPLAALCFALLWVVYLRRWFWLTGLAVGLIAFVDFKWATPAGLSVIVTELIVETQRPLRGRLQHIVEVGLTAIGVLALAALIHRPYSDWLKNYITQHTGLAGLFEPSAIFFYFLLLFGAAPTVVLAAVAYALRPVRHRLRTLDSRQRRSLLHALVLSGVPIAVYSLTGTLKGLRFFAVLFPVFAVVPAVLVGELASWANERSRDLATPARWLTRCAMAALLLSAIVVASDGPARHLRLAAGFERAIRTLAGNTIRDGTISSYQWPVVHYGWGYPIQVVPSTIYGLLKTDKWLILNPVMDRCLIDYLRPAEDADSLWVLHEVLKRGSDSLFSVGSDYYASDYFCAEFVTGGIPSLQRVRRWRSEEPNYLTVYRINIEKLRRQTAGP
jgi:hypothetical protein